VKTKASVNKTI